MSDTKAYPPWVPAVNGTGQHPWFLIRGNEQTVPPADRYLLRADGQLRRFASMESAQEYADKINANASLTTVLIVVETRNAADFLSNISGAVITEGGLFIGSVTGLSADAVAAGADPTGW